MKPCKYEALVLDMDGTIIDSLKAVTDSLEETASAWNLTLTDELIRLAMFSSAREFKLALPHEIDSDRFMRDLEECTKAHFLKVKIFPGMEKVFQAPIKRGIVTSESHEELLYNLNRLGFSSTLFEALVGADDTPYEKPHPYPLLHCLKRMNTEPCRALFVGDSVNDIRCANAAGVDFGLALWGAATPEQDKFKSAAYLLKQPEDILELLIYNQHT